MRDVVKKLDYNKPGFTGLTGFCYLSLRYHLPKLRGRPQLNTLRCD